MHGGEGAGAQREKHLVLSGFCFMHGVFSYFFCQRLCFLFHVCSSVLGLWMLSSFFALTCMLGNRVSVFCAKRCWKQTPRDFHPLCPSHRPLQTQEQREEEEEGEKEEGREGWTEGGSRWLGRRLRFICAEAE